MGFTVNVPKYMSFLYAAAFALILVHVGLYFWHYNVAALPALLLQMFDLDEENNLPTWYSGFILLNIAFFLYVHARTEGLARRRTWLLIAVGFLVLAIDEVAGIHETFNSVTAMNWAIPGGIAVLVLAVVFVPFLLSLRRNLAILFVVSGTMFVGGAIGVELLSEDLNNDSLGYKMAVVMEEGLEMLGALLFLFANLRERATDDKVEVSVAVTA